MILPLFFLKWRYPISKVEKKKTLFNAKIQALSNVSIVQGLDKNQNKYSAKTAMSKRHESDSCQLKFRSFNDQQISPYPRDQITLSDDD